MSIAARLGRAEPAGDDPVREVRPASAAQPAERALCPRGHRLNLSTLADQVGACTAALAPLLELIRRHVLAAERLHGDDTTVPVLAKGKTITGRFWTYVRDDRPFGGPAPPAAMFYYSRDRGGEHPRRHLAGYAGILQADAYAGFSKLYEAGASPGRSPRRPAGPWPAQVLRAGRSRARRRWRSRRSAGSMRSSPSSARSTAAAPTQRLRGRARTRVAPLVAELEAWMRAERARLSRHADVAKAIDYMLKRWPAFTRFLDDGRICLTNNAAERALRGIALGRKAWLFAGSDRGGERAAAMYTLIVTAKLNDVDPQAWLADVLRRIADHPASRLHELLPWNWKHAKSSRRRLTTTHHGLRRMLTFLLAIPGTIAHRSVGSKGVVNTKCALYGANLP